MESSEIKFLYLSHEDMIEAGVLNMSKSIKVIEEAFKLLAKGDYLMGGPGGDEHGMRIYFPKTPRGPHMPVEGPDRRLMAMPAYLGGEFNIIGQKWARSNRANIDRGLPRMMQTVLLDDAETGQPLVVMEGTLINAIRTGAVPAVGAKYLAKKDSEVVAIIGAGVINRACLMAIAEVLKKIKQVKVLALRRTKSEAFCHEMTERLGLNIYPVDSLEEAIRNSDVVSFATSGEKNPFVKTEWIKDGAYLSLTAVVDFEDDFWLTNRIVVDNWKMHLAWRRDAEELSEELPVSNINSFSNRVGIPHGDIHRLILAGQLKDENIENLGPIVSGTRPGRTTDEEKIVLVTGGMAIEDLALGYSVYQEAMKKGIGQELTLWKKPLWR